MDASDDERFLRAALALACRSARAGGGPFGAVVARDGRVIASGTNRVVADCDPSAHAELMAIRAAARALESHDLSGFVLYASCEPCPMCIGAVQWARLDEVVYAADREDAARAGFDDRRFHEELVRAAGGKLPRTRRLLGDEGGAPFEAWRANAGRATY